MERNLNPISSQLFFPRPSPGRPIAPDGAMTSPHRTPAPCPWLARPAAALAKRSTPSLAPLFLGAVTGRPCCTAVAAAGKNPDRSAASLMLRSAPGPPWNPPIVYPRPQPVHQRSPHPVPFPGCLVGAGRLPTQKYENLGRL